MTHAWYCRLLFGLTTAWALSGPAAQQLVEADDPAVVKAGAGFTNMFIRYGRVGMGSGDYIVTTSGTNDLLQYAIPEGHRSVSVLFLFHNQGQVADAYIDDHKRATIDTFARSSVAQRMGGVAGQVREVLIASDLDPAKRHRLKIVNHGRSNSDSGYLPRQLNQGPCLAVDAIRTGDFAFGTVAGGVRDESGATLTDVKLTISSAVGPIKDAAGRSVFHSDGFGRYSISGLDRGRDYRLSVEERFGRYSAVVRVPEGGGELVHDIAFPYVQVSRPRMTVPAFVLRGGSFEIEVEGEMGLSEWGAKLKNAYTTVGLRVDSADYGPSQVGSRSRPGWLVKVKVPRETPLEVWDLEVTCSGGRRLEPRCVKVLDSFERSFYIAQITDVHCYGDPRTRNDFRLSQVLSTLDAIGARFITITGDLCHFKGIRQVYDSFNTALASCSNTLTCVLPGNHDTLEVDSTRAVTAVDAEYNRSLYERHIGQARFDFRMGEVYVLADDIFSGDPNWAVRRFAQTTPADRIRLFLSHYDTLSFDRPPYPTIQLFGHNHVNRRIFKGPESNRYPVLSVVSVNDSGSKKHANEFRLVRFDRDEQGRWSLGTYTYDGSAEGGVPLAQPMGGPITNFNIVQTYQWPNDGKRASNRVSLLNRTLERFETARARLVMTNGTYTVTGGKVLDSYCSEDETKRIVLVEFEAAPQATTSVTISPAYSGPRHDPPKAGSPAPASAVVTGR